MATQYRKAYVPVTLDVDKEGAILPRLIWCDNGVIFQIDQILYTYRHKERHILLNSNMEYLIMQMVCGHEIGHDTFP